MQEIGNQYSKDDTIDKTGFRRKARLHQSMYRANVLKVGFDEYGNRLTKADGIKGLNFYVGFSIIDEVRHRYPGYKKGLYSDMLRSEHIPFNFFVPFDYDKDFCKKVLNDFLGNKIKAVNEIKIEYAPPQIEKYLNDRTSFDAYIEFTHISGENGIIGIEVKYTEHEYKLKSNSKEEADIKNEKSIYYIVSDECGIYKPSSRNILPTDKFRQVWRNHLLGEKILLEDNSKYKYFTSLTLFPKQNSHFIETSKEYIDLLKQNENKFLPLTYEDFLSACKKYCPNSTYKKWIDYLTDRYIIERD